MAVARTAIIFLFCSVKIKIMKKHFATFSIAAFSALITIAIFSFKAPTGNTPQPAGYMYKQITAVESVVPGGLGRSRILTTDDNGQLMEKELRNFYSMVGINFENIANNDRVIVDKLNDLSAQGWELFQVVTGSNQQSSNGSSSGGLFISRYIFRKPR
jgi:hypothetical protein